MRCKQAGTLSSPDHAQRRPGWAVKAAWAGLIGSAVLLIGSLGCNPLALFLIPAHVMGVGDSANIKFKFPKDAKRVAVVVHMPSHNQVEVGHFDRDVNNLLAKKVADYLDRRPVVVLAAKVHQWLDENHDWKTPYEIGRGLKVDHVIFIEIRRVSFYEREGWTQYYKGLAEMSLGVYRVGSEADESIPIYGPESVTIRYPNTVRPVSSSELSLSQFRELFVRHAAERLSWYFVPHATNLEYGDSEN
jgi:hypothetical protein